MVLQERRWRRVGCCVDVGGIGGQADVLGGTSSVLEGSKRVGGRWANGGVLGIAGEEEVAWRL